MLRHRVSVCILGFLLVAMVMGAPLSSGQEQAVNEAESDVAVDRAKRADEQIVFGNVQNQPRTVSKKSDPSQANMMASPPMGQLDQGSQVVVHEAMPVEQDLADRADAARKDFEDNSKIADAMEEAMAAVDQVSEQKEEEAAGETAAEKVTENEAVAEESPSGDSAPAVASATTAEENSSPVADDSAAVGSIEETEVGRLDTSGNSEEGEDVAVNKSEGKDEETDNIDDEDIEDLLQATRGQMTAEQMVNTGAGEGEEEAKDEAAQEGEADVAPPEDGSAVEPTQPVSYEELMNMYSAYYDGIRPMFPSPSLRSGVGMPWNTQYYNKRSSHPGHRIKRDLLEDAVYSRALEHYLYGLNTPANEEGLNDEREDLPAVMPSDGVEVEDDALISDPDEYVPLTEAEEAALYEELEDFLAWDIQRRAGEERLRDILGITPEDEGEEEEVLDDEISPEEALRDYYNLGRINLKDFTVDESDRELPQREVEVEEPGYDASINYPEESLYDVLTNKRASAMARRGDYYYELPRRSRAEKRYFFPFADEPATHWSAFVPEKRGGAADERSTYVVDPYSAGNSQQEYSSPAKRGYDEAIHRLQRLAMALSDNRGPYYSELMQEQPYKK